MARAIPTLRQLQVFRSVARHLSFTRASEALHLSQPAVSMQVKQLEATIGLPLFEHLGKRIFLTDAGEVVYAGSQNISRVLDEMGEAIDGLKGVARGRLRLSVATTAGFFATRMLAEFARQYPEVTISLDVTNRARLLEQLEANECDLTIMGEPPADRDLVSTPFMENPLVIVAAPNHALAGRRQIPVSELAGQAFVVREPGSGTRAAAERFFETQGVAVQFSMVMSSNEAIKQAVQAGLGLGIASLHTLELQVETGRLVLLDVVGFPLVRHWYLVQRQGKRLSPAASRFESFVREQGAVYGTRQSG